VKTLLNLPKEKLVEVVEKFYLNLIKEPKYDIYSKTFFIEYLNKTFEIYKRYKNLKINILLFKFDSDFISLINKNLRKSDLVAKYENAFVILLVETGEIGTYKVKNKLEKLLNQKGVIVNINLSENLNDIIEEIETKVKIY